MARATPTKSHEVRALADLFRQAGIVFDLRKLTSDVPTTGLYWQWPCLTNCPSQGLKAVASIENQPVFGTPWNTWGAALLPDMRLFVQWYSDTALKLSMHDPAGWAKPELVYTTAPFIARQARAIYSQPNGWPHHCDDAAFVFAIEAAYHAQAVRFDVTLKREPNSLYAVDKDGLLIAGVINGKIIRDCRLFSVGYAPTVEEVTQQPRGMGLDADPGSALTRLYGWLAANWKAFQDPADLEDALDAVRRIYFTYMADAPKVTSLLVQLQYEATLVNKSLEGKALFSSVVHGWGDLGDTDLQRFGAAMIKLCPSILSVSFYESQIMRISGLKGAEPTDSQRQRGYSNLKAAYYDYCAKNSLPI